MLNKQTWEKNIDELSDSSRFFWHQCFLVYGRIENLNFHLGLTLISYLVVVYKLTLSGLYLFFKYVAFGYRSVSAHASIPIPSELDNLISILGLK